MPNTQDAPTATPAPAAKIDTDGPSLMVNLDAGTETLIEDAPTQFPPEEILAAGADEGIAVWLTGKKIVRVWSNASLKNSWINIQGTGWRRFHAAHEGAVVAMTILASHARADNRTVNVRLGNDNQVHELYVW